MPRPSRPCSGTGEAVRSATGPRHCLPQPRQRRHNGAHGASRGNASRGSTGAPPVAAEDLPCPGWACRPFRGLHGGPALIPRLSPWASLCRPPGRAPVIAAIISHRLRVGCPGREVFARRQPPCSQRGKTGKPLSQNLKSSSLCFHQHTRMNLHFAYLFPQRSCLLQPTPGTRW